MRGWTLVALLGGSLALAGCGPTARAAGRAVEVAGARTVLLLRHAEKEGGEDPGLSVEGKARAATLAHVLSAWPVDAIFVTPYRRTRETARKLSEATGVVPLVVDAADIEGLADRIRRDTVRTTVVVGHSNTVPALIEALGAGPVDPIPETVYDDLFVVTLEGGSARLLHLKYGAPTPP